jgi:hypothetical protein
MKKTKKKINPDLWASHIEIMALTQLYDFFTVLVLRSEYSRDKPFLLTPVLRQK